MISHDCVKQLLESARAFAPHEMCGLLFSGDRFHLTKNCHEDPEHAFKIDLPDYLAACEQYGEKPWALVHSHPNSSAAPSVKDCTLMDALDATNNLLGMVIVGLKPESIRMYQKRDHVYACMWSAQ